MIGKMFDQYSKNSVL